MNLPAIGSADALGDAPCAIKQEDRYRALIEASQGVVWRAAADLACLETWGWDVATGQSQAESIGDGWLDAVHPEDREPIVSVLNEARREGQAYENTYRARQANGNYRWVHCRCVPMRNAAGAITEWVGHLVDVHERIEAELALRRAEERLRLALETCALVVWEYTFRSGVLWWSEGKRIVLGLSEDCKISPKESPRSVTS